MEVSSSTRSGVRSVHYLGSGLIPGTATLVSTGAAARMLPPGTTVGMPIMSTMYGYGPSSVRTATGGPHVQVKEQKSSRQPSNKPCLLELKPPSAMEKPVPRSDFDGGVPSDPPPPYSEIDPHPPPPPYQE